MTLGNGRWVWMAIADSRQVSLTVDSIILELAPLRKVRLWKGTVPQVVEIPYRQMRPEIKAFAPAKGRLMTILTGDCGGLCIDAPTVLAPGVVYLHQTKAVALATRRGGYPRKGTTALTTNFEIPGEELAQFCRHNHIDYLALFGSASRGEMRPDSDVDLLVDFAPETRVGFMALARMQRELAALFHRPVDLVLRSGLKPLIREDVLRSAKVLYAA